MSGYHTSVWDLTIYCQHSIFCFSFYKYIRIGVFTYVFTIGVITEIVSLSDYGLSFGVEHHDILILFCTVPLHA